MDYFQRPDVLAETFCKSVSEAEIKSPEEVHRTSSSTGLQLAVNLAQFWHIGTSVFQWNALTYLRADTSMPKSNPSWQCGQVALGLAYSHPLRLSQTVSHPKAYLHVLVPNLRFSCYKDMSFHRFWIHHFYPGLRLSGTEALHGACKRFMATTASMLWYLASVL